MSTLCDILFPGVPTIQSIINRYPERKTPMVTRIAPSPTGFLHIWSVYTWLLNQKLAHQAGGIFFVRVEDTDQARNKTDYELQQGWIYSIINGLEFFDIPWNEGINKNNDGTFSDIWSYWPYTQSHRLELYKSCVAYLLETNKAYVCFMTPEELEQLRTNQQLSKQPTGVYGSYALNRNLSESEVISYISQWKPWVIRRKAPCGPWTKTMFHDGIKWEIEMEDNFIDQVVFKSDGFPTYALAHIVDDYLMGTTHVIRADERLPSVPFHRQLFQWFSDIFTRSWRSYNHCSPIQKLDNGNRRKLSKRKDPEADVQVLIDKWYPAEGIKVYLMCLLNSNFEERRKEKNKPIHDNQNISYTSYNDFTISLEKCNISGAIFDIDKLNHICSEYLSIISIPTLLEEFKNYNNRYNKITLNELDEKLIIKALSCDRNKKLHTTYLDIMDYLVPLIQWTWIIDQELFPNIFSQTMKSDIMTDYVSIIESMFDVHNNIIISKEERREETKKIWIKHGFAGNKKEFEQWWFIGMISDIAMMLRVLLYGKQQTPDLYNMITILGKQETIKRLQQ